MIRSRHLLIMGFIIIWLLIFAGLAASCGRQAAPSSPTEAATAAPEVAVEQATAVEEAAPVEEEEAMPVEEAADEVAEETTEETVAAASTEEEEAAPTEEATEEATEVAPAAAASSGRIDMDAIFPPGEGREMMLMACTGCHNWVPVVILGLNEDEWDRNARTHRDYVSSLTDEDFETVYIYLKENFHPDTPVPELPKALLDAWTSY